MTPERYATRLVFCEAGHVFQDVPALTICQCFTERGADRRPHACWKPLVGLLRDYPDVEAAYLVGGERAVQAMMSTQDG